ncbi:hypothetical protein ACP8HI_04585 [Paenibacillus sp. FA6]|uniref:hypothetical protein n=1 Tax=Paenibacillus sp. FA6 TaxID=3413029 RepID=UPI003F65C305
MNTTYKVLSTDTELFAAALAQVRVYVVQISEDQPDCIVDYGGPVQKYTPETVKITDKYYMRERFEFRIYLTKTRKQIIFR